MDILATMRGSDGSTIPAKSADPTLDLLINQMRQLEAIVRLQEQQLKAADTAQKEQAALLLQLTREKQAAEEGMRVSLERIQKVTDELRVSPEEREKLVHSLVTDARHKLQEDQARFVAGLRSAPMGEIYNYGGPVHLGINGVLILVRTGRNKVPAPYVDAWEGHLEAVKFAADRERKLHPKDGLEYGQLEAWRAGVNTRKTDGLQLWNKDLGGG